MCDGRKNSVAFSDIGLDSFMAGRHNGPAIA